MQGYLFYNGSGRVYPERSPSITLLWYLNKQNVLQTFCLFSGLVRWPYRSLHVLSPALHIAQNFKDSRSLYFLPYQKRMDYLTGFKVYKIHKTTILVNCR